MPLVGCVCTQITEGREAGWCLPQRTCGLTAPAFAPLLLGPIEVGLLFIRQLVPTLFALIQGLGLGPINSGAGGLGAELRDCKIRQAKKRVIFIVGIEPRCR